MTAILITGLAIILAGTAVLLLAAHPLPPPRTIYAAPDGRHVLLPSAPRHSQAVTDSDRVAPSGGDSGRPQ